MTIDPSGTPVNPFPSEPQVPAFAPQEQPLDEQTPEDSEEEDE